MIRAFLRYWPARFTRRFTEPRCLLTIKLLITTPEPSLTLRLLWVLVRIHKRFQAKNIFLCVYELIVTFVVVPHTISRRCRQVQFHFLNMTEIITIVRFYYFIFFLFLILLLIFLLIGFLIRKTISSHNSPRVNTILWLLFCHLVSLSWRQLLKIWKEIRQFSHGYFF